MRITKQFLSFIICVFVGSNSVLAQQSNQPLTQRVSGVIVDNVTKETLPGANIILLDYEPLLGTSSNADGEFLLSEVPVGRHDFKVSFLGYKPIVISEVLVTAGKEVILRVEMKEDIFEGESIEVVASFQKEQAINDMAFVSAKTFTIEETQRYAGGLDDPARLVTVFAGVTSTGGVQNNAISIRGNAPKSVQWRLEGIEIPNPNHFAGLSVAGGGGLTLFSAQLLANSDFYTGAFPSEYGNALSGVFDINFRSGPREKREHAFQLGLNGIEASSGGPFKKNGTATYLFNYRFSTLTFLQPLLPTEGAIRYQDISFKVDVPTKNSGRFELWGVGGLDYQTMEAKTDSSNWEYAFWDFTDNRIELGVGALGLSHSYLLNSKSYIKTTLALSGNSTKYTENRFDDNLNMQPYIGIKSNTSRIAFKSYINQKLGKRIVLRSGFEAQELVYNVDIAGKLDNQSIYTQLSEGDGSAELVQIYSNAKMLISPKLTFLAGLHGQWFSLNEEMLLEPRASLDYQVNTTTGFSVGYGLHSQIEELSAYFVQPENGLPNRKLEMTKAHHLVAGVKRKMSDIHLLKAEVFWQYLYDVPVIADSSFSMLNFVQDFTFNETLVNDGEGKNYGLELTFERYMDNNYYYMLTGTFYSSTYKGGDGVWRDTRFNQNIATNLLVGKEFEFKGGRNLLGVNGRVSYTGGERYSPVSQSDSKSMEQVVFDESKAFTRKFDDSVILDLTVNYRRNFKSYSSIWALQIKNVLGAKDKSFDYNYQTKKVDLVEEGIPLPLLSWKVEF
tara:strand:- start:2510 stop:4864 length:2355 start_codon:yes stop_codon:yes gene_type:complete